jgi:hypothetical protein
VCVCARLQVEEVLGGRILVVFAESLEHLHEQCVLASRAGCVGVIVVGNPNADFTLDEYRVLRSVRSSRSAKEAQKALGNVRPSSRVPTGGSTWSPNGHGNTSPTGRGPQTPASRKPSTRGSKRSSRPNTGSSQVRYGRVSEEGEGEDDEVVPEIVTDGKNSLFFKIPIPVVWVTAEDAAYVSDGTMVSIYWHENLLIPVSARALVELIARVQVCFHVCIAYANMHGSTYIHSCVTRAHTHTRTQMHYDLHSCPRLYLCRESHRR